MVEEKNILRFKGIMVSEEAWCHVSSDSGAQIYRNYITQC